jgi:hypothetical protein
VFTVRGWLQLRTNRAESGFQLSTTDGTVAGDKTGGIIVGIEHHFGVANRGGGVGGKVETTIRHPQQHIAGGLEGLRLGASSKNG